MTDTQTKLIHSKIWNLISDYADIRDELEGALESFQILYSDLELAMEDISNELGDIEEHLCTTSRTLKRFRVMDNSTLPEADEEEELPWN